MTLKKSIKEWMVFGSLTAVGLLFILFRIVRTGEIRFVFLSWNLILAMIPLFIVQLLQPNISRWSQGFLVLCWLLFFPNAPYMVTDLIHLKWSGNSTYWFDFLLISYFAVIGIIAGFYSFRKLIDFIRLGYNVDLTRKWWIYGGVFLLSGFGLFLGRILRWNSWDIVQQPQQLFYDVLELYSSPIEYNYAWKFTFFFAILMGVGYYVFNKVITKMNSVWTYIK